MKKIYYLLLLVLLLSLLPMALPAYDVHAQGELTEVELQPDGASMKDTQIVSSTPTTNYATSTNFGVGETNSGSFVSRSILEFDLSGLPNDATIVTATLSLWVDADQSDNARTMYAYPMNSEWVEAEATWNKRNASTNWQTAGAAGTNDASSTDMGSVALANDLAAGAQVDIELDAEAIQAMLHQNYFGFKLQMATESDDRYLFRSSDHATGTERPKLTIEYYPDTPTPDPGWYCIQGTIGLTVWPTCDPAGPVTVPISPFIDSGSGFTVNVTYGGSPNALAAPAVAAKLNCTPYPRCINDYPVYYRITYDANWEAAGSTTGTLWATLLVPGGTDAQQSTICGSSTAAGECFGVFEGTIPITDLPVNYDGTFNIGLLWGYTFPATWPVTSNTMDWTVYLSLEPFDQDCADTYMVPVPYTYTIDPTIETPVGPVTDYQIYDTVAGSLYMVRVENGPWDDGTDPRTDAAVSLDGSNWLTWEEFSLSALCIDTDPINRDYDVLYFTATTTEFYIRANDTAGNFANNTNDIETPFQYVIGLALPIDEGECGSQFTFDDVEDLIATVEVPSTDGDVSVVDDADPPSSEILQSGEWYGIEVTSGTWHEPAGEDLISMQYVVGSSFGATWEDLAEGSTLVECVVDTDRNIVFIQANDTQLHLRVDDQDLNFANNTGTLDVSVYHVAFDRRAETCELQFALDDLVRSDSVDATQGNGKVFALSVGSAFVNTNEQTENFLSYGLVPGAWYALETTGGPWRFGSSPNNVIQGESYELQVAEEPAGTAWPPSTPDELWGDLAEWDLSECNIQTDKLGHRLIYFQIPVTDADQWKLRVADEIRWPYKAGSMSWNLYRVIDLGASFSGSCDYSYAPEDKINESPYTVNATAANGAPLVFEPDTYYAVEILGEDYQWLEVEAGEPQTGMQISLNNGQSWGDLPDTGALCSVTDGDNLIFFIHTGEEIPYFKLRVDSASFSDNEGLMGWNIYTAEAGTSINPWDNCISDGYSTVSFGPIEWIPVTSEQGRMITSTTAGYAEIDGLVPGNRYVVETSRGPWYDNAEETVEHEHFTAQVSADDGTTWEEMDGTNSNVSCWESSHDFKYRKIEFVVEPGQVWRIRVADDGDFTDNSGQLAYTLKGEVLPVDTNVQGHINIPGCNVAPIFPESIQGPDTLTLEEISDLGNYLGEWLEGVGNYLGGWVDYGTASVIGFLSWCPEHTEALSMFGDDLRLRDPFATLDELDGVLNDIRNEINSYDWDEDIQDYSILNKSPAEATEMIETYIFGPLPDDSPWLGNDLVDFNSPVEPTAYYESCQVSLKEYVGPLLGEGVCFSSNWAREVGFSFWIQLALDVAIFFACIHSILGNVRGLVYLFTGVNLSVMKSDAKVFVNYVQDNERGRR